MTQNRLAEARAETQKALDLDPVSPIFTTALAETSYYEHDFDDTIAKANLTLEQSPHFLLAEYWLGSAYREKRMYPEAIQHFRTASSLVPSNPALFTVLAHTLALSGDRQGATTILNQLQAMANQRYVPAMYFAAISIGLGEKNKAFEQLDRALAEHDDRMIYLAVEPMADPLRSDARFQSLLARLHLDKLKQ
jgi:tetratricopeptide (TPR) repeat protein